MTTVVDKQPRMTAVLGHSDFGFAALHVKHASGR